MTKEEDLQKKIIEFQILESNLKVLQERANVISQRLEEVEKTKSAIEELKGTKPTKALIPLGSGNFIFGSIESSEDVIVGIGSGVALKKNREGAVEILDNRIKEIEDNLEEMSNQSTIITEQLEKIQEDVEELQK
jgi:prefoldin alpha subunit